MSTANWDQLASELSVEANDDLTIVTRFESAKEDDSGLPARVERFDENTGIKTVITHELIDEDTEGVEELIRKGFNARKIIQKYRVEVRRVPKLVAARKKLSKFGLARCDPPGPSPSTTSCKEEIRIQYVGGKEFSVDVSSSVAADNDDEVDDISFGEKKASVRITCAFCGLNHLSSNCPSRPSGSANVPGASTMPPSGADSKYVPPNLRGATIDSGATKPPNPYAQRSGEPTIRVTNLPDEMKESDLRDLFQSFGRITRAFMPRDKVTGQIRGFAFVTFDSMTSAKCCVATMNGYGYAHMVLGVEIAESRRER